MQEKYGSFLTELCGRSPQERYDFLRSHPLWQKFNEDLMAYYPLVERRYHVKIDPGVLFLSLGDAIRTYELSKGLLFVWIFMKSNFEHRNQLRRDLGDAGGMVYANESKLPRIIKLIRSLDQEGELTRSSRSAAIDKVMSYFEKYEPETVSRRAVEDAWDRWQTSLVPMEGYDSEGELVIDQTAGKAIEQHQEQEEQVEITDLFDFIFQNPGRLIKETVSIPGKDSDKKLTKRVALIRYYLTRELLKALKLKTLTRRERDELLRAGRRETLLAEQGSAAYFRDYMEELHMDARKTRQTAGEDGERFYYRWKCHRALPDEVPVAAGNSDVYDALLPYADQVMQVMEEDYIEVAVEDGPEPLAQLEGVYYNLLHQGFRFADKQYNDASTRFRFSREGDETYREWTQRVKRYVARLRENE